MKTSEHKTNAFLQRGCHIWCALGMAVALAGFVLIWSPWTWLMLAGAATSCAGTIMIVIAACRLAALLNPEP